MGGKHSDDETPPNHSAHHKADEKGENGDAEHRDTVEKNAESKVRGRRGGQQKGDGPGKPAKKPWSSGLAIKPAEVLLAVLVVCVGFCVWQKQAADAKVALCAQRHERGEYEEALKLCHEALVSYHELNELSKLVGWRKYGGILNGDVAQTTVGDTAASHSAFVDARLLVCFAPQALPSKDIACGGLLHTFLTRI